MKDEPRYEVVLYWSDAHNGNPLGQFSGPVAPYAVS